MNGDSYRFDLGRNYGYVSPSRSPSSWAWDGWCPRRSRPGPGPGVVLCSWQDQAGHTHQGGRGDDPGAGWGLDPFSGKRVPAAASTEAVSGAPQLLTWHAHCTLHTSMGQAAAEANQLDNSISTPLHCDRSAGCCCHPPCPLARGTTTDRGPLWDAAGTWDQDNFSCMYI